jgi:hypothetical protein
MNLLARFHRWRLAKTDYWLPYEEQIHELLTSDSRLAELHDVLQIQIASLYVAYRSCDPNTLSAKYAYTATEFYDVSDEFTLCGIQATNARGSVHFGGGMLSEIRITPVGIVNDPKVFRIADASLVNVTIPKYVPPPPATGWVAELEEKGILIRYGVPKDEAMPGADCPAYQQYNELFNQCDQAAVQLQSETFYFHPPPLRPVEDRKLGDWMPLLDLRELGGLALTRAEDGCVRVSYMLDGCIEWTEPDLVSAIEFVHARFGK